MRKSVLNSEPAAIIRYAAAVAATAVALGGSLMLQHLVAFMPLFLLCLCAVLFAVWYGGLGPGLLALALSVAAFAQRFHGSPHAPAEEYSDVLRLTLFVIVALCVLALSARQRAATRSLRRARDDLQVAVDELRRSERDLQAIVDTIPARVGTYSPDGSLIFINKTGRDFSGFSEGDIRDGRWDQAVHPDDAEFAEREWRACVAKGEPFQAELRMRRSDGEYRWFSARRVPLRDRNGKVVRWYSAAFDIEGRKRAELALRESEARLAEAQRELQLMLDRIPTLAWQTRADGYAEYLNKPWLDYTGLPLEQALGWEWQVAIHPDDLPGLLERWHRMLASGQGEEVEARMRRHDGAYRWFLFRPSALHDDAGRVLRWYGTNTDIEDRRRAEQALRGSEACLNEAQRLSVTGSFSWRVCGVDVAWSKEMYRIFDLDPSVKPTVDIVLERAHVDDVDALRQFIQRMVKEEDDLEFEYRLALPNAISKQVRMRTRRVQLGSGEPEVVGALMDVTAARKAEEALRRAQADLAHATRVATLGELSASIAHEVNQPLASIATSGEAALRWLQREEPDRSRALKGIMRMINEAQRASEVIGRIRAFAKKAEPQMSKVDVNQLVKEVITLVQGEAESQRVAIWPRLAHALPPAHGDKVQLQQVLINLVMNGIQATASVTDRVRILVIRTEQKSADQLLISVEDAGIGMEREDLGRLFGAFYTTKPNGLGMGLSISRSIVEAHGGSIWATPNAGPGMTFQFTLAIDRDGAATTSSPAGSDPRAVLIAV